MINNVRNVLNIFNIFRGHLEHSLIIDLYFILFNLYGKTGPGGSVVVKALRY
jgi:hypothetical protein